MQVSVRVMACKSEVGIHSAPAAEVLCPSCLPPSLRLSGCCPRGSSGL